MDTVHDKSRDAEIIRLAQEMIYGRMSHDVF